MKTYMQRKEDVTRKWYVIDAEGVTLGRLATKVASILRGKHKPEFTPHCDCGDHVIILNASKAVLTGKKLQQKVYYRHTGWIGGLKEVKAGTMMNETPEKVMELAVKGMVPDNTIGREALTRLRVYAGAEHPHAAQQPEVLEF